MKRIVIGLLLATFVIGAVLGASANAGVNNTAALESLKIQASDGSETVLKAGYYIIETSGTCTPIQLTYGGSTSYECSVNNQYYGTQTRCINACKNRQEFKIED